MCSQLRGCGTDNGHRRVGWSVRLEGTMELVVLRGKAMNKYIIAVCMIIALALSFAVGCDVGFRRGMKRMSLEDLRLMALSYERLAMTKDDLPVVVTKDFNAVLRMHTMAFNEYNDVYLRRYALSPSEYEYLKETTEAASRAGENLEATDRRLMDKVKSAARP